ncbi:MAG TPA: hypothetical protein VG650_11185 [Mycobacteriales bacterium]|nr:hypothetical protein [Mycobacteriales bacterium]
MSSDFPADLDTLMAAAERGQGPMTMADIAAVATQLGEPADDTVLLSWLRDNAVPLVGQQLLVASVRAVEDPEASIDAAISEAREALGAAATVDEITTWLSDNRPGALRAWLVRVVLPEALAARTAAAGNGREAPPVNRDRRLHQ